MRVCTHAHVLGKNIVLRNLGRGRSSNVHIALCHVNINVTNIACTWSLFASVTVCGTVAPPLHHRDCQRQQKMSMARPFANMHAYTALLLTRRRHHYKFLTLSVSSRRAKLLQRPSAQMIPMPRWPPASMRHPSTQRTYTAASLRSTPRCSTAKARGTRDLSSTHYSANSNCTPLACP